MRAAVLHAQNDIRVESVAIPSIGEHDVLVQVKATGICGSDIPRVLGTAAHYYPITLGHEFSGVVAEVGSSVTHVKQGDHVVGVPLMPCKQCSDCQKGNFAQCKHYSFVGSRQNGSWAEFVSIHEHNVIPFDPVIPFEMAAFVEPAAVALHALKQVNFVGGKDVAIIGAGTIGLLLLQWALAYGAKRVVVIDINEKRLELASELGATETILSTDENRDQLLANFKNQFDFVLEAAGTPETIKLSFHLVSSKGSVCLVGTPTREVSFSHQDFELINRKEFYLTGSWMSYSAPFPGDEWSTTLSFIKNGKLDFTKLIDQTFELNDVNDAFDLYRNKLVNGKIMLVTSAP